MSVVVLVVVMVGARVIVGRSTARRVRRRLLHPAGTRQLRLTWRRRPDAAFVRALPDALEAMARRLRAGETMPMAIAATAASCSGALADDLRHVNGLIADGLGLVDALDAWTERRPLPAVRLAVAALALGRESGGSPARAIDAVASSIRERLAADAEVKVFAAQAKLSAVVIGAAPLAFAVVAVAFDPSMRAVLFTPAGVVCLVVGLGLDASGAAWMLWLSRSSRWPI